MTAIVITKEQALAIAVSGEYRSFVMERHERLTAIMDHRNPNRQYGISSCLFGVPIRVEDDQTDLGASDDRPLGPDSIAYRKG